MSPTSTHLSDEDHILLLDGEQPPSAAQLSHLAVCPQCRERQAELKASSEAIAHLYRSGIAIPPAHLARIKLQHKLYAAASPTHPRRWSFAAAATLLFAAGLVAFQHRAHRTVQAAEIVPNLHLTPGATRPVQLDALCTQPDVDQDPAVTPALQQAVLTGYGLNSAHAGEYQIDYLINPQLGGTADVHNLWPEPYRADAWNARAKDALETRLHQMVCTRQIDLATAQRELASNWIAAYKKYFRTTRPLS